MVAIQPQQRDAPTWASRPSSPQQRSVMRRQGRGRRPVLARAQFELEPKRGAELPSRFLDACDGPRIVAHDETCADIAAVRSITLPSAQPAIFEVPPPISTFITAVLSRTARETAPEP